jgi:hypothetical protein
MLDGDFLGKLVFDQELLEGEVLKLDGDQGDALVILEEGGLPFVVLDPALDGECVFVPPYRQEIHASQVVPGGECRSVEEGKVVFRGEEADIPQSYQAGVAVVYEEDLYGVG